MYNNFHRATVAKMDEAEVKTKKNRSRIKSRKDRLYKLWLQ